MGPKLFNDLEGHRGELWASLLWPSHFSRFSWWLFRRITPLYNNIDKIIRQATVIEKLFLTVYNIEISGDLPLIELDEISPGLAHHRLTVTNNIELPNYRTIVCLLNHNKEWRAFIKEESRCFLKSMYKNNYSTFETIHIYHHFPFIRRKLNFEVKNECKVIVYLRLYV